MISDDALKPYLPGSQERYSYLVKFYQDDELYGMYVWAINEDEAKSQVSYYIKNVKFKEVTQEFPKGRI